ncbi:hypothetical protein RM704_31055 [Streptomyces sp. DSM 3412]|uniref:Uncharacterized protein n=1 Tax=Streptomyces gottesmaniae TaxID=3075518 RepID=A0ABU2Z5Z4_9ACTN|nr:hypothetical protein [Streptomyces sp. DSM 3412]MDT0571846.1 hypothetical protein [Streptomyces sp. DSM 3412]
MSSESALKFRVVFLGIFTAKRHLVGSVVPEPPQDSGPTIWNSVAIASHATMPFRQEFAWSVLKTGKTNGVEACFRHADG